MPEIHPRSGSRTTTWLLSLLLVLASALITLAATALPAEAKAIKTARASYPQAIEPLAGYQPQTTCSPTAKPGVANFAARLLAAYPSTRSLGIVRACSVGGRSEHKEGRAFDWGVSANTASTNGDFGIDAAAGVTDLGGNTGSGNGNPLQCRNVFCG